MLPVTASLSLYKRNYYTLQEDHWHAMICIVIITLLCVTCIYQRSKGLEKVETMFMTTTLHSGDEILALQKVSVRFGQRTVLSEIDLSIRGGEFIGLIGPNGAGKSTLLKILLGLLSPSAGSVRVLGSAVRRGSAVIGYVPQKIHLDPGTPLSGRDLVGLGLDGHRFGFALGGRHRRERIDEALRSVDAIALAQSPVGRLSGGEQQRLLIAQALLTDPKILLLDEPLSNLDIKSAREVVRLVARISRERGVTVMLVAHDMNPLLDVMDRIVYLAHGHAAIGSVAAVVQSDVLSGLYGYPVEVLRTKNRILVVGGQDTELEDWNLAGEEHCDGGVAVS